MGKSLQIHLSGAPGSGKSALAESLCRPLVGRGYQPLQVIDNVQLDIEERFDLAVGMGGGWLADFCMAIERIGQIREAQARGTECFIVCGGLAESACHTSINAEISEGQYAYQVATTITPVYPLLRMSLGVHPTFLLPYVDDEVIFHKAISINMPLALEALQVQYTVLPEGIDAQVQTILQVIDDAHAEDQE